MQYVGSYKFAVLFYNNRLRFKMNLVVMDFSTSWVAKHDFHFCLDIITRVCKPYCTVLIYMDQSIGSIGMAAIVG